MNVTITPNIQVEKYNMSLNYTRLSNAVLNDQKLYV